MNYFMLTCNTCAQEATSEQREAYDKAKFLLIDAGFSDDYIKDLCFVCGGCCEKQSIADNARRDRQGGTPPTGMDDEFKKRFGLMEPKLCILPRCLLGWDHAGAHKFVASIALTYYQLVPDKGGK